MHPIRHILIAVKNPDRRSQKGVEKALRIAKRLGASVELFHAISSPVFLDLQPLTGQSVAQIRREALSLRGARLEKLAARGRKAGVKTTSHVAWDFPPHEAIVRRAAAIHADLIVAECHEGKRLTPWLMHLTDWELLRTSPRPVLVLKNDRDWRDPVVLGAVDPSHAHAKPEQLDAGIVAAGEAMSRAFGGSFELLHANFPATFALMTGDAAMDAAALTQAYDQQRANSKAEFDAFASKMRVPRASRHLLDTDPGFAIPHMARKLGADLVVMGAVSRSGLKRVFIGNTAERVLEALPCDVLVIKPTRFPRRVSRASRGMRVVPPQPLMPLPV
ncbi:MAG TPA: universal stress protein [Steroidobacteraceae bacterium]|nr:universal stress protein [Steroidobacteraceae bacterium]